MRYGDLPLVLGEFELNPKEMMFYQYLPIKMLGDDVLIYEPRLSCFNELINKIICEFISEFGYCEYLNSYVYLTAKSLYQAPNSSFNRMGWHSDGFMTDDINYVWCDKFPTVFNNSSFNLTLDDVLSMKEMDEQAIESNDFVFGENKLLRLNQFNIHRVAPVSGGGIRTFLKLSISKDRYDLIGNSHNYLIDYNWEMKPRKEERNVPQSSNY